MGDQSVFYRNKLKEIKELANKWCLVCGYCEVRSNSDGNLSFKGISWDNMGIAFGFADERLVLQAFEEYESIETGIGDYTFWALLSHSPAQIGNYPPPNVEVEEYFMIEYVEYENANPQDQ